MEAKEDPGTEGRLGEDPLARPDKSKEAIEGAADVETDSSERDSVDPETDPARAATESQEPHSDGRDVRAGAEG